MSHKEHGRGNFIGGMFLKELISFLTQSFMPIALGLVGKNGVSIIVSTSHGTSDVKALT